MADAALVGTDYSTAQSLSNSFNAGNVIESNWQSVNSILIKLQNDTLNSNDISTLQSVAEQCPHSGGNIVWKAREMLSEYYRVPLEYPNDCPANNGERKQKATNKNQISKTQSFSIYPNPNNGSFTVSYMSLGKQLQIDVYNIMGQPVLSKQYALNSGNKVLVTGLSEGIYFIKISVDNMPIQAEKIIVNK